MWGEVGEEGGREGALQSWVIIKRLILRVVGEIGLILEVVKWVDTGENGLIVHVCRKELAVNLLTVCTLTPCPPQLQAYQWILTTTVTLTMTRKKRWSLRKKEGGWK